MERGASHATSTRAADVDVRPKHQSPGALDRIDFVEDSRMHNVVSLQPDRPRPQRVLGVPRSGARILFFTGVRYCRDEAETGARPDGYAPRHGLGSERMLDAAAH